MDQHSIIATVEVLMIESSTGKTWTKDFQEFRSGRAVRFLGYGHFSDGLNWKSFSAAGDDINEMSNWLNGFPAVDENSLRSHAEQILLRSQNLMERMGDVLLRHME